MIHDLYLRAHIVVSGDGGEQADNSEKRWRSPKLWPDYALVFDTETTLDLEQRLNFGVWRFCQHRDGEYVTIQEGIFHRDDLDSKSLQTIASYMQKYPADGFLSGADPDLTMFSRADFVERAFWGICSCWRTDRGF